MGKKDIFLHGTLCDRVNWEQFFDPKNYDENFLEKKYATCEQPVKVDASAKKLSKVRTPRPRESRKGGKYEY